MAEVARTHAGSALGGRLVLDGNGDLALPDRYAVSRVGADGSWAEDAEPRAGTGTCSVGLERATIDLGAVLPGQRSEPDTQTVVNTGTRAYGAGGVSISAGGWEYGGDSPRSPLGPGLTQYRAQGGEYASVGAAGSAIPGSALGPGEDLSVQLALDLTSMPALGAGRVAQTITYSVSCS